MPRAREHDEPWAIGRSEEVAIGCDHVRGAGKSPILIIEGAPGLGKTTLLRLVQQQSGARIIAIVGSAATRYRWAIYALARHIDGREWACQDADRDRSIIASLSQNAGAIVIDDAHRCDLASLRYLVDSLDPRIPLILAVTPHLLTDSKRKLLERLEGYRARTITLEPLDKDESAKLVGRLWPFPERPSFLAQHHLFDAAQGVPAAICAILADRTTASRWRRGRLALTPRLWIAVERVMRTADAGSRRALLILATFPNGATREALQRIATLVGVDDIVRNLQAPEFRRFVCRGGDRRYRFVSPVDRIAVEMYADPEEMLAIFRTRGSLGLDHTANASATWLFRAGRPDDALKMLKHRSPVGADFATVDLHVLARAHAATEDRDSALSREIVTLYGMRLAEFGHADEALALLTWADARDRLSNDGTYRVDALYILVRLQINAGSYASAIASLAKIIAHVRDPIDERRTKAMILSAGLYAFLDRPERALSELNAIATTGFTPALHVLYLFTLGRSRALAGDTARAKETLLEAIRVAESSDTDAVQLTRLYALVGTVTLRLLVGADGIRLLRHAYDRAVDINTHDLKFMTALSLVEGLAHIGEFRAARLPFSTIDSRNASEADRQSLLAASIELSTYLDDAGKLAAEFALEAVGDLQSDKPHTFGWLVAALLERAYLSGDVNLGELLVTRTLAIIRAHSGYRFCFSPRLSLYGAMFAPRGEFPILRAYLLSAAALYRPDIREAYLDLFHAIVELRAERITAANRFATKAAHAFQKVNWVRDRAFALVIAQHPIAAANLLDETGSHAAARAIRENANRISVDPCGLSPREREVCRQALLGHSSRTIATNLLLQPRTVDNHLQSAYRKLGIRSRYQLDPRLVGGNTPRADTRLADGTFLPMAGVGVAGASSNGSR